MGLLGRIYLPFQAKPAVFGIECSIASREKTSRACEKPGIAVIK